MHRSLTLTTWAAVDSSCASPLFGPVGIDCTQNRDLESFTGRVQVTAAATEAAVALAPVTTGYFIALLSDYPVKVRLNGASGTQFTLTPSQVASVNTGSPLPYQCAFVASCQVTELRLAPISGATRTANVTVFISGDPTTAY